MVRLEISCFKIFKTDQLIVGSVEMTELFKLCSFKRPEIGGLGWGQIIEECLRNDGGCKELKDYIEALRNDGDCEEHKNISEKFSDIMHLQGKTSEGIKKATLGLERHDELNKILSGKMVELDEIMEELKKSVLMTKSRKKKYICEIVDEDLALYKRAASKINDAEALLKD